MHKNILNIALIFLLTSCSTVNIGYSIGDWLIKKEILSRVKLYKNQQQELEKILDKYMLWHEKEMLPQYLKGLSKIKILIKKETTSPNIKEIQSLIVSNILETISKLGHDIAPVLSGINDKQLDRSRVLISRAYDKRMKKNKAYRSKDVYLLWKESSVDWLGELNDKQEAWLKENVESLYTQKDSQAKMAMTGKRQQGFIEIFEESEASVRLQKQKDYWDSLSANYKVFKGRPHTEKLLIEYFKLIDNKQKENIIKKLEKVESTIKSLM